VNIVGIARQTPPRFLRLSAASKDGHAVPRLLPMPDRAVADLLNRGRRKLLLRRFQLLQADDIRLRLRQSAQQDR
jgi:hypothetical protein